MKLFDYNLPLRAGLEALVASREAMISILCLTCNTIFAAVSFQGQRTAVARAFAFVLAFFNLT